ncbi:MAG: hypothetical protein M3Y78_15900 [Pseudomonadota bacterium]|nr:hypothetical protein [Pseudomonadota bacterium]
MRKVLLVAIAASAAGCVSPAPAPDYEPRPLTADEVRQVETDIRRELRNPDALFSGLKGAASPTGPFVVCGWVNQRDDFDEFPRFVGHRPFVANYADRQGTLREFRMVYLANVKSEAPPLYSYCSRKKIPL